MFQRTTSGLALRTFSPAAQLPALSFHGIEIPYDPKAPIQQLQLRLSDLKRVHLMPGLTTAGTALPEGFMQTGGLPGCTGQTKKAAEIIAQREAGSNAGTECFLSTSALSTVITAANAILTQAPLTRHPFGGTIHCVVAAQDLAMLTKALESALDMDITRADFGPTVFFRRTLVLDGGKLASAYEYPLWLNGSPADVQTPANVYELIEQELARKNIESINLPEAGAGR